MSPPTRSTPPAKEPRPVHASFPVEGDPDMTEAEAIQKVKIDPVDCYKQAFELVKEKYWLLVGVSAVGMMIGGAVPVVLIGPMMCGIFMCFLQTYRGKSFEFDLLFKGFDLFVPSLIASLIMTGISLLIFIPAGIVMFATMIASMAALYAEGGQTIVPAIASLGTLIVLFLIVALIMVVSMLFTFTFPLIVDRRLTGPAAISVSAKAVVKNFAGVLGLMLISSVLGIVGVMACYVGSFFLLPISFAAMTIAYRKVFPEIAAAELSLPEGAATPEPPGAADSPA